MFRVWLADEDCMEGLGRHLRNQVNVVNRVTAHLVGSPGTVRGCEAQSLVQSTSGNARLDRD